MDLTKVEVVLNGTGQRADRTIAGYFTSLRKHHICPADIPAGFTHIYECRGGDDGDFCTPVTIEEAMGVNHAGTLFLQAPLQLTEGCFRVKDFVIVTDSCI